MFFDTALSHTAFNTLFACAFCLVISSKSRNFSAKITVMCINISNNNLSRYSCFIKIV